MPLYFSFKNFVDTDECLTVSPCHANATCNNTEGSYTCTCDSGFSGDGVLCNGTTLKILMRYVVMFFLVKPVQVD